MRISILVGGAAIILAACAPTRPDTATPTDIAGLQQAFLNSDAVTATLYTSSNGSYTFDRMGNITYGAARVLSDLTSESTVTQLDGNKVCVPPSDNGWSGVCIDVYTVAPGEYFCEGTFGNGFAWKDTCVFELDG